jgi:hypothetical protein
LCHQAFAKIAKLTKWTKKKIYGALRDKALNPDTAVDIHYFRTGNKVSKEAFTEIKSQLLSNQVDTTESFLASFVTPNTIAATKLKAWMENFFKLVGDQINDEIHLDSCPKQEIHEEYCTNMQEWFNDSSQDILGYSSFLRIWDLCFPHVLVRNANNKIGTKCVCCDRLSLLRRRTKNHLTRLRLSELHAYHRHMYMNEKAAYHRRIIEAIMYPDMIMSLIGDGMDKAKTTVPRLPRVSNFIVYFYFSKCLNRWSSQIRTLNTYSV